MTITVEARYENGVLKPDQPLPLGENEKVRVTVESHSQMAASGESGGSVGPSLATLAEQIVARAQSLPPDSLDALPDDLAAEHDHYLYGTPKRNE